MLSNILNIQEEKIMICGNCGKEIKENSKFCEYCGATINNAPSQESSQPTYGETGIEKAKRKTGIIDIIAAAILLFVGIVDVDYDWGILSFCCGVGILVAGILQVIRKSDKVIGIVRIVFGGITILVCFACDWDFDWTYIGLFVGITLLVVGILGVLHKSWKAISIVLIVFGGILLLLGLSCIDYDWGITGTVAGVSFLVSGILNLVSLKKS